MYVGSKGIHLEVNTGWDLTGVPNLTAIIERPDQTPINKELGVMDFSVPLTTGVVNVPFIEGDLTIAGVYHLQLVQSSNDVKKFTHSGTFAVANPLGA